MGPNGAEDREELLQADPPVVRVGDTVRRPTAGAAVHALLTYLEQVGFPYSPRMLGVDQHGREVLTYLPGISGRHGWAQVVPDAGLRAFADLLRAYHDAIGDFAPTVHAWALQPRPPLPGEIICHGDFGPWNVVWDAGNPPNAAAPASWANDAAVGRSTSRVSLSSRERIVVSTMGSVNQKQYRVDGEDPSS